MIELMPDFMNSEYFIEEPEWRMKEDAPADLKDEFERFQNSPKRIELYKRIYPNKKNPYYKWTGKIVDMG